MFKENSIVITNHENKRHILQNANQLRPFKIYDIEEFKKLLLGSYRHNALTYIKNKYHVKLEVAEVYLQNLLFIVDKEYHNPKLDFLRDLKKELIDKNLYVINNRFINHLHDKTITIYNLEFEPNISIMIEYLKKIGNVEIINEKGNDYSHIVHQFPTRYMEVAYVAEEICKLRARNIPIEHIFLANISEEYKTLIKIIFPMFHIPVTLKTSDTLLETSFAVQFLRDLETNPLEQALSSLEESIKTKEEQELYNQILTLVNTYIDIEDLEKLSFLRYEFSKTKIKHKHNKKSVHEITISETLKEDDYCFLLGFNQGIIPKTYKDENYLESKELDILCLDNTTKLNKLEKEKTHYTMKNIKNVTITFTSEQKAIVSNLIEDLQYEVVKHSDFISHYSNTYNIVELSKYYDVFYKFKMNHPNLYLLHKHYKENGYKTYDHTFTGINPKSLQEHIKHLTLSYSSLDKYYKCPFAYYVSNILKIDAFEESFAQTLGTIFHACLEKKDGDFETNFKDAVQKIEIPLTARDTFFIAKLKEELEFILEELKEQESYTHLHKELHEEKVTIPIHNNVTFTGIIDKIKYVEERGSTYYAIIDYKTGVIDTNLSNIVYGIGMQLPVYLYLIKHGNVFQNPVIAGIYYQKIINNETISDKSLLEVKKDNLKWQGYSNSSTSVLEKLDSSYTSSNLIKSLKVKTDGSFYSYSKVLTSKEFEQIINIVEQKINEGVNLILNGEFSITPKRIHHKNSSCEKCTYRDVCYMRESDIQDLEEQDLKKVLEGL